MDKSTVLKSTIAFLKHHNEATDRSKVFEIQQDWKPSFLTNDEFTHLMLESLDGFIIVFSSRGTIYYASESVTPLLGYLPSDILNRSIYDLTYAKDHESLFNIFLNPKPVIEQLQTDINASNQITFYLYLKRGRCDSKDVTFYELVKFVGYFRNNVNLENLPGHNTQQTTPEICRSKSLTELDSKLVFVGTGRIQKPQLTRQMCAVDPLRSEFTSKHSMEWKFLFLDQRAPPIIGYMPFEVLGTSGYDYYHFDDLDNIVECHEKLMQNGEGKSCFYRFLTKGQQWIWLQTDYYISYHQYNSKPDYVMCNHRVVSYADVRNESKEAADSLALSHPQQVEEELGGVKVPQRKEFDNSATAGPFDTSPVLASSGEAGPTVGPLNVGVGLMGDGSPSALETSNIWAELSSTATTPMTPPQKPSRPASSFGYISPGISPKRSKYLKPSRGNESDSTSISAESGTSRHSLLTHPSSGRQRHNSLGNMPHQSMAKHMNSRHLNTQPNPGQAHGSSQQMTLHPLISPTPMQLLDPSTAHQQRSLGIVSGSQGPAAAMPLTSGGPGTSQQKIPIPMLAQPSVASSPLLPTGTCQYSQAPFPLRSSQIVGSGFLEPPQYLAAIPVQPVISTFPVTPVLSPLPVSSATFAGHRLQPLQHDSSPPDMIPAGVVMSPGQNQLQDRLQRRHDELQQIVMQKQDELRIVSEQLLLARYTYLQPVLPYNGLTTSPQPNGRPQQSNSNSSNNNNTNEPQFNQYGFALNSEQLQNQQDQAMIMQQQETLTQQQHQNVPHPQQQQQQQQALQQNSQAAGPSSGQQDVGVMQQSPASQLTHLMDPGANLQQQQQTVPPTNSNDFDQFAGDDMDVFFNLSPLQSMTTNHLNALAALSRAAGPQSAADVNNVDASGDMGMVGPNNNNNNSAGDGPYVGGMDGGMGPPVAEDLPPIGEDNGMPVGVANEDPILSYMQLASQNQFAMTISEEDSETQGEETKVLQDRLHQQQQQHHQHQQQQQQQQHQLQLQQQQHAAQHQHQHANQHQQQQQQSQSHEQQQHHHHEQQHHEQQQHQQQQELPSQRSYYTGNPFDNSDVGGSDSIPNDLEILQYQMSQEQSQNLFNSSAPTR